MSLRTVHIGGVPEHFNYPWYLLLKSKSLQNQNINLRWRDFDGGTGAMLQSLVAGEIDLAVMLTEGVIKAICDGAPIKLIQYFVSSPLVWGVHTHKASALNHSEDLVRLAKNSAKPINVAISRFGSGSHLMAYLYAKSLGINPNHDFVFREVGDLDRALIELKLGKSDIFLWEKFTTQPYVTDHDYQRIDAYPTPWPCFVLAGREDFVTQNRSDLQMIQQGINNHSLNLRQRPDLISELATRYHQEPLAIEAWLAQTHWSQDPVDSSTIDQVQKELANLGLIKEICPEKIFF